MARPLFNEIVTAVIDHDPFFCNNFDSQYVRRDHGPNPFILLEAVASQDLWIWHAFFGVAGSNNDINVLYQSTLFNDLKTGRAPEIPFVPNGVTYPSGYYLVDGIYPELAPLVKTIPESADDDHKRILYKQKQESARKDVEQAFGVLKKKWVILANPTRALKKERIINMMYTCIILHNMIRKYKKYAISPKWFLEEMHQPNDPLRNEEQVKHVMRWIRSAQAHQNLRHTSFSRVLPVAPDLTCPSTCQHLQSTYPVWPVLVWQRYLSYNSSLKVSRETIPHHVPPV
ncbi:ALP1-like protein [Tanacetum coccineum]